MSLYVLDTDILTLLQTGHVVVVQRVGAHQPTDLAITIITVEEQWAGRYAQVRRAKKRDDRARAYQQLTDTVQRLAAVRILSFTEPALMRYEQLKGMRLNVGKMDLAIAAITLEHSGILVTRNVSDFQRIPNLTIENSAA
jgi:tRNA(fMet)-specific endonuclease VapC